MRHGQLERSIAIANAKREIAARIRPVCEHFCQEEFETLVQRMAEVDVHFRLLDDWLVPPGPTPSGHRAGRSR